MSILSWLYDLEVRHQDWLPAETSAITMMIVMETMVMKLDILPQSLVVVVVNNHEADNKNNVADDENKGNADAVD
eukprot:4853456-Ditylum_brightwellii.AAC.1